MVYGFLYIIGESYVAAGGDLIFEVNGTVGAKLFHVIRAIPDAIVLLGTISRPLYMFLPSFTN